MAMDHVIPTWPRWLSRLQWAEFALGILYLALIAGSMALLNAAYSDYYPQGIVYSSGQDFGIFAGAWTFVFMLGVLTTTRFAKGSYLKWFHLGAECLTVVFWVVAMALTARDAASVRPSSFGRYGGDSTTTTLYGLLAAGAFFAGVEFVMFVLTLVFLSIGCHNARMDKEAARPPIAQQEMPPAAPVYEGKVEPSVTVAPPLEHQGFYQPAAPPVTMPAGLA